MYRYIFMLMLCLSATIQAAEQGATELVGDTKQTGCQAGYGDVPEFGGPDGVSGQLKKADEARASTFEWEAPGRWFQPWYEWKGRMQGENGLELYVMCEIPSNVISADAFADIFDGFSIGSNDLTQLTYGFSRDDIGGFLPDYLKANLLDHDPFQSLDQLGVGELVQYGCERGRATRPDLKLGICGEHGGDPASIRFFQKVGLDYVSCSPFRVPIARLVAAQAALG